MLTITLDWLAFTFKEMTHEAHEFITVYAGDKNSSPETAFHGYSASYRTEAGVICSWNDDRPEMGYHIVMGGSTIRELCSMYKISQTKLLEEVIRSGANITRLDIAKDLREAEVQLSSIWSALQSGKNSGTARTFGRIESNDNGYTIYIGSRQSEKFIRIYNKAAQSGLSEELWFRFELETKGMFSRAIARELVNRQDWGLVFDTVARGMVDLGKSSSLVQFYGVEGVPIGLPKLEHQTDREKWIATQVIAAVSRHYIDNPNSEAVARLISTLNLIDRQRKL